MTTEFLTRLYSLEGQAAVVIGGSGAMGGALAEGLAQAGAAVVVAGRSESPGHRRVELIRAFGGEAGFMHVDVTRRDSIEALLDRALGFHGVIDILVNAARLEALTATGQQGSGAPQMLADLGASCAKLEPSELSLAELDSSELDSSELDSSELAACLPICDCTRAFAREMARQEHRGAILNLARPPFGLAQSRTTRALARKYAPQGIRVNAICLGGRPAESDSMPAESRVAPATRLPLDGPVEPQDLVGTGLALLSRRASRAVTGAAVPIDGGDWERRAVTGNRVSG